MGHKVNPIGWRVGITKSWRSRWFSQKEYNKLLLEDIRIRQAIFKKFKNAGISEVIIERFPNSVNLNIYTSRPGVVIGRSGAGIEELKEILSKLTKATLKINIEEVKNPNLSALLVASTIASQIEKRISYRRACKQALARTMEAQAEGIKIKVSGRLAGVEIARTENFSSGKMPLSTLRSDIDYACLPARTTYGTIGVKVWIYKGTSKERIKRGPQKL